MVESKPWSRELMILEIIKDWFIVAGSSVLLVFALLYGYMTCIDGVHVNPPIVYEATVLPVDKDVYAPGDVVSIYMDATKLRDVPGRVTWHLVNGRVFPYATRDLNYPTGTYEKWIALDKEPLPTANLIEGEAYHYEAVVEKDVNTLKTIYYKLRTVDFKIKTVKDN
jgi:hypothetical protein